MSTWYEYFMSLPLEWMVVVTAFVEEIFPPLPGGVFIAAAAMAELEQGMGWTGVVMICILGALSKAFGCWITYELTDKGEDLMAAKFPERFAQARLQVEKWQTWLSNSWWDDVLLFLLRAIPIVPTFLVSIAAGLLRINRASFIATTIVGLVVRNLLFAALGIYGVISIQSFL
jgi:membrane protein DedA with SNARE-associated domain